MNSSRFFLYPRFFLQKLTISTIPCCNWLLINRVVLPQKILVLSEPSHQSLKSLLTNLIVAGQQSLHGRNTSYLSFLNWIVLLNSSYTELSELCIPSDSSSQKECNCASSFSDSGRQSTCKECVVIRHDDSVIYS